MRNIVYVDDDLCPSVICRFLGSIKLAFNVLITCNPGTRKSVIDKIKEFKDIKNIQQRKDENQLLLEIDSNDAKYVQNNVINRIKDFEDIAEAALQS